MGKRKEEKNGRNMRKGREKQRKEQGGGKTCRRRKDESKREKDVESRNEELKNWYIG